MMKDTFYFTLVAVFVLSRFLSLFGHEDKRLDQKAKVNFKIFDVINWETNNYNTHFPISQKVKVIRKTF